MLVLGLLPTAALAENETSAASAQETTATVNFTAQAEGAFLCAPQFNVEVSSQEAENFGYTDSVTDGVSALDVLVKAHEIVFKDAFTKADKDSFLVVDGGIIKTLFGTATTNCGFYINGQQPHGDTLIENATYGNYYLGYNIAQAKVNTGDFVEFAINRNEYGMDYYAWFTHNGAKLDELTAYTGESVTLTAEGYCMAWYGCSEDSVIETNIANTKEFGYYEDAVLAWVDAESGDTTSIKNAATEVTLDENHSATITMPAAGTYYLTLLSDADAVFPILLPLLRVTVKALPDANITAPTGTTVFVGSKEKHFKPFAEIQPAAVMENSETGTMTYYYELANNKQYNYRVTGEDCVTYAGVFKKTANWTLTVTDGDLHPSDKTPATVDRDLNSNNKYNVADIWLNINAQNYLKLAAVGDTYQLVNLRNWEAVDTTTNNYFIEPDYHYTVLNESGQPDTSVVTVSDSGLITATGNGTAIVLVTYDAINIDGADGGPFFGAIWPENTGVFVVSVGAGDSGITTGMTINEEINADLKLKNDGTALDSEHDVIYYTGDSGSYTFVPGTKGMSVTVANPTVTDIMSFSGFKPVSANADGSITVPLIEGRNIVKLTKGDKVEYQVITAKKVTYTVNNGAEIHPGDSVSIQFNTVYNPINKLAGVYNYTPAIVYTQVQGFYGKMVGSKGSQYQFAATPAAQTVAYFMTTKSLWGSTQLSTGAAFQIPEDYAETTLTLSGGTIGFGGWGSWAGEHRNIKLDVGKLPNLNADSPFGYLGQMPDIVIPITLDKTVTSIEITTQPTKTEYWVGDSFSNAGMQVKATYSDGSINENVTSYTISPEMLTAETTMVTVSYGGKTATVPVTVTQPKVTAIEITKAPDKTNYTAGDVFDPTGMVITATYENGRRAATTDYTYAPTNRTLTTEDTAMTITYTGTDAVEDIAAVTQTINVAAAPTDPTQPDPQTIIVSFALLGDSKHGDTDAPHTLKNGGLETWISATDIEVPAGSKVVDALTKALGLAGIPYENPTGNYVSAIRGLAEFDNGDRSGWMYTLNGIHPTLGVGEQTVRNGDVIVFHYTDDYAQEQGSEVWDGNTADTGTDEKTEFIDVAAGTYYCDAVKWAVEQGITTGTTDTTFSPNEGCTRSQMVTFLWRAAGSPEPTGKTNPFTDVKTDAYYYKALLWAIENGITKGTTETTFSPDETCTRGQMATFLYRNAKSPAVTGSASFTDVETGAYYSDAVAWAFQQSITKGATDTTFEPDATCTRGQMVTFLYRYLAK